MYQKLPVHMTLIKQSILMWLCKSDASGMMMGNIQYINDDLTYVLATKSLNQRIKHDVSVLGSC